METALLLAGKITELTLIVLMGFILVKCQLLQSKDSYPLSVISLYIISPSVMIHAFQIDYTPEIIHGLLLSLKLAILFHIILIILGKILKKLFHLDPLEHAATMYSNSGNLIIPLVMSIFGSQWVIYTSGFIVVQTFLIWTHLRLLLNRSGKISFRSIITNINLISLFIGLLMFILQIKLPSIINGTLSSISHMIGPMAMLIAGMLIAALPLRSIILSSRIYLVAFLRLIFVPLIMLLVIKLFGFSHQNDQNKNIILISFLATISPSAATMTQMALLYQHDANKASAIYGMTTLLCIITMPIIVGLYQWLI